MGERQAQQRNNSVESINNGNGFYLETSTIEDGDNAVWCNS